MHRPGQQFEDGALAGLGFQFAMLLTADLFTPRLTEIAPFLRSCPMHEPEDTPSDGVAQVAVPVDVGLFLLH